MILRLDPQDRALIPMVYGFEGAGQMPLRASLSDPRTWTLTGHIARFAAVNVEIRIR